jgi:hypothetical protein
MGLAIFILMKISVTKKTKSRYIKILASVFKNDHLFLKQNPTT